MEQLKINKNLIVETVKIGEYHYQANAIILDKDIHYYADYGADAMISSSEGLAKLQWKTSNGESVKYLDIIKMSFHDDIEAVINKINSIVELKGMTQYKLMRLTGLSQGVFSALKNRNMSTPTLTSMVILAKVLGYSIKIVKDDE